MMNFNDKIFKSFKYSRNLYLEQFKSYHWKYQINQKKDLYKIDNLKNFRKNKLSQGLDDQFYTAEQTKYLFESLKDEEGSEFVYSMLDSKNIGNVEKIQNFKDRLYSSNELFHIKYLSKIKDFVELDKKSLICEIGSGYGCLVSKILRLFDSKIILIDLPESNFLSSYYLKSLFPEKKFFLTTDIKNNKIEKGDIENNEIIIICPWDNLPALEINFFINSRSMMEMNNESIKHYFELIQNKIKINGHFLCINRYYKDTVGYPVELHKYPFDKNWEVILSEQSWNQDHVHFLFLKRTQKKQENILNELKKIKKISRKKIKSDPRVFRRIIPDFLYKIYKKIKFLFLKK